MDRINVRFYDEVTQKLRKRTAVKKTGSLAQSVRELVDLGFKVEEATSESDVEKDHTVDQKVMLEILKTNTKWTLESLLLVRNIIENLCDNVTENSTLILKNLKEQAASHIKKMFPE